MHRPSSLEPQPQDGRSPMVGWLHPTGALYEILLRLVKSFPSAQWLSALRQDLHRWGG
jgi:hypothetical protein